MRQPAPINPVQFFKSAIVGGLTGLVFAIVFLALPGAALIFVVGVLNMPWDLSWFPDVITIMSIGGGGGALFAVVLYIKDRHIPYVEDVQNFEEDGDNDRFNR